MSFLSSLFSSGAGNLIESVGKAIDSVVTSDEERQALENELRRAEMDYQREMRGLDIKETELYLKDIDSAREHQTRVQESEEAGFLARNIQPLIALIVIAATFGVFAKMLFAPAKTADESNLTMLILGTLGSLITTVVAYYFGSSRGTDQKTSGISALSKYRK